MDKSIPYSLLEEDLPIEELEKYVIPTESTLPYPTLSLQGKTAERFFNGIAVDVAEADGIETGENREGMFFAARTFAMKWGQALAMLVFTSLAILGTTQDLKSNDLTASPIGLRIIAIVAVVFCVLGAVILGLYKEKKVMGVIEEAHKKENLPE